MKDTASSFVTLVLSFVTDSYEGVLKQLGGLQSSKIPPSFEVDGHHQ